MTDQPQIHPAAPAPAKALTLTDAETNRQIGRGEAPHGIAPVPLSERERNAHAAARAARQAPFVMGFRDVDAPRFPDDEPNGKPDLFDRLAQKDRVPVTRNGIL